MTQLAWRAFQIAIVFGVAYAARSSDASPGAIFIMGILCAALATGILAALLRLFRRLAGAETVEDRIWRQTPAPRSNLAPPDHLAEPVRFPDRAAR